ALDRPRSTLHDAAPDLGGAREGDLRDIWVLDQAAADDATRADDDVDDSFRKSRVQDELSEAEGGERRQLGGFEHGRIPARERGTELPAGDVEGKVPGDDQPDDAERFAEGQVDTAGDGDRLAVMLVDGARVEVEDLGDHPDLRARAADRFADVLRFDLRELVGVFLHKRGEA